MSQDEPGQARTGRKRQETAEKSEKEKRDVSEVVPGLCTPPGTPPPCTHPSMYTPLTEYRTLSSSGAVHI